MRQSAFIYAGRLERFFAYLLDTLVMLLLAMFLVSGLGPHAGLLILTFVGEAAYYTLFTASGWQASPAQRLLSIRIVRLDGKPIDTSHALLRYLAFVMPRLPMYSSLLSPEIGQAITGGLTIFWFAPILFTPDRAGIHDQLSNMRVVVGRTDDDGKPRA